MAKAFNRLEAMEKAHETRIRDLEVTKTSLVEKMSKVDLTSTRGQRLAGELLDQIRTIEQRLADYSYDQAIGLIDTSTRAFIDVPESYLRGVYESRLTGDAQTSLRKDLSTSVFSWDREVRAVLTIEFKRSMASK